MSGRLQLIEDKLKQINSAKFQNLCDTYLALREREFSSIQRTGSQYGKEKTVKGTPDSFLRLSDNKLAYIEHTTQTSSLPNKIIEDINKCLDKSITKVDPKRIHKIIICFNQRLSLEEEVKIQEHVKEQNVHVDLIGIDTLALEILSKHLILAREFLDIKLETGQIQTLPSFVREYNNKANQLSTPLDNEFFHRSSELKHFIESLKETDLVVISGAPGVGKTKIGLELVEQFLREHPRYNSFVIVKKDIDIYEDLKIQLQKNKDYILLVDDANRQLLNLKQIFGVFKEIRQGRIKLVVTVRNYALPEILKESMGLAKEVVDIPKFSDKEITAILESDSFKIVNSVYQKKIVEIADGNARLAIMGAKVALENQYEFLEGDVGELYDTYFQNFTTDIDLFRNVAQLQVLGLIAFFFTINREDRINLNKILENFNIDYYTFNETIEELHKKELVEIQYNHVRISEQVMATYFFYLVFIKDEHLSFETLLFNYFDSHGHRFQDTVIPANNSFGFQKVFSKINEALDRYIATILTNEERILKVLNKFWFYKPEDVLNHFGKKIKLLPEPENPEYNTQYDTNDFVHHREITLDFLTRFFRHQTESFTPAIFLAFEYIRKKPKHLPELVRRIRETLLFDERDERFGFSRQRSFIESTRSKINEGEEHYCAAFFPVAQTFLQYSFEIVHGGRKNSISFYQYPIPNTKEVKNIREIIWGIVFSMIKTHRSEVINFINNFRPSSWERTPELLRLDLSLVIPFILKNFSPEVLIESATANELIVFFKEEERIDQDIFKKLKLSFDTQAYRNFKKLDWNRLRDKEEFDFDDWREYERLKSEDLKKNFIFGSNKEFFFFLNSVENFQVVKNNTHSQIENSLEVILQENYIHDNDLGLQLLEGYLKRNFKIGCLHKTVNTIVKSSQESAEKLWEILKDLNGFNDILWRLNFFASLPINHVNYTYYKQFLRTLNAIRGDAYIPIKEYEKFTKADRNAIEEIVALIAFKNEKEGVRIRISEFPFADGFNYIKRNYNLAKNLYFQQFKFGQIGYSFDYERRGFKNLYENYSEFLFDFFTHFYSKNNLSQRNKNLKLSFIWDNPDRIPEINKVVERLIEVVPYFGSGEHSVSLLFLELNEKQLKAALEYCKSFIQKHQNSVKHIEIIFAVIRRYFNKYFEDLLLHFLSLNSEVEFFRQVDWAGNPGVQMGNVNWGELDAKRWEKILAMVANSEDVVETIPIKGFLKKRIQSAYTRAEGERMREFIRPSDF
jgi:DNA polymerase III delta prime subunit